MNLNSALLLLSLTLPLLTALVILTIKDSVEKTNHYSRILSCCTSCINLALSIVFFASYNPNNLVYVDLPVLASIKFYFFIKLSGIAVLFFVTTNILFIVSFGFMRGSVANRAGCVLLLLLQTCLLGVFTAYNTWLFFIFVEMSIFLLFCLLYMYSKNGRIPYNFMLQYGLASGLLFTAFVYIYAISKQTNIETLHLVPFSRTENYLLWWLLFSAFSIKSALVPWHLWLKEVYSSANTIVTMIMSCIILKLGIYGCIRILILGFPHTTDHFSQCAIMIFLVTTVYSSVRLILTDETIMFLGYFSLFQVSIQLMGIFALNPLSTFGGIFQTFDHSILVLDLSLIFIFMAEKIGHTSFSKISANYYHKPSFKVIIFALALIAAGLPASSFFTINLLTVTGLFTKNVTVSLLVCVFTFYIGCVIVLKLYRFLIHQSKVTMADKNKITLSTSEMSVSCFLLVLLVGCFLYTKPFVYILTKDITSMLHLTKLKTYVLPVQRIK